MFFSCNLWGFLLYFVGSNFWGTVFDNNCCSFDASFSCWTSFSKRAGFLIKEEGILLFGSSWVSVFVFLISSPPIKKLLLLLLSLKLFPNPFLLLFLLLLFLKKFALKCGFDRDKVFEVQGSYAKRQCSIPCHNKLYDNEVLVKESLLHKFCGINV